ncbi:hypothetical protein NFI96_013408 [Prochilodus magdalenae]|nr:hypothetical protein NFI96_013408 [Prochilodus magdalenae]
MRFLVRRWKKATGGSVSSPSINRNGVGQTPGIEGRNDSPYLQPSVEQYGERRGPNRTGRDSPRAGHYAHHRYGAVGGDGGSVLCSHLQNYDPDRALTDYISRLEALQRRLGSVQSDGAIRPVMDKVPLHTLSCTLALEDEEMLSWFWNRAKALVALSCCWSGSVLVRSWIRPRDQVGCVLEGPCLAWLGVQRELVLQI